MTRYDLFKLSVALALLAGLLGVWSGATPSAAPTATATARAILTTAAPTLAPPSAAAPATATLSAPSATPAPVTQTPTATPAPQPTPALDPLTGALTAGRVIVTGASAAGDKVQITLDGQVAGTVTAGADGRWSFAADLGAGGHTVSAAVLDPAGLPGPASPVSAFTLTPAQQPSPTPAIPAGGCQPGQTYGVDQGKTWLVDRCDNLAYIARKTGIDFNALVAANPQVADPNLIFPGQLINLPGR